MRERRRRIGQRRPLWVNYLVNVYMGPECQTKTSCVRFWVQYTVHGDYPSQGHRPNNLKLINT